MPWTPRQTRYLLSSGSPLDPGQKNDMKAELHANPSMAHAKKGQIHKGAEALLSGKTKRKK